MTAEARRRSLIREDIERIFVYNLRVCKPTDSKIKIHNTLQRIIKNLARNYGLVGSEEYNVEYATDNRCIRNGLVDVVWLDGKTPIVAIEIDSSYRSKSITKLETIDTPFKFWLYYGMHDVCALPKIPDAITVIRERRM